VEKSVGTKGWRRSNEPGYATVFFIRRVWLLDNTLERTDVAICVVA